MADADRGGPLTIGIDTRTLTHHETAQRGIGQYTRFHIRALRRLIPETRFRLYVARQVDETLVKRHLGADLFETDRCEFAVLHSPDSLAGIDLFHAADQMSLIMGFDAPLSFLPGVMPGTVVFYDLIPWVLRRRYFDRWPSAYQRAYLHRLNQISESSVQILAISEATKFDLIQLGGIPSQRITAIMAGLNNDETQSPAVPVSRETLLHRFSIDKPFFLVVGGVEEHKNFSMTFQAAGPLLRTGLAQLVVVGSSIDPWKRHYKEMAEKEGIPGLIVTGFIERDDLIGLYRSATALCFPSEYEGFGFPVLEAMAERCPVICTEVASLKETAGNAAIIVAPGDVDAMSSAMTRLLSDAGVGEALRSQGLIQSARFSWSAVAKKTTAVWRQMLSPDKAHQLS